MFYATQIFTRCRTQLRCISYASSLTRTTACSDPNSYLTLVAMNSNKIDDAKVLVPKHPIPSYRSLLEFTSALPIAQPKVGFQLLTSRQMISHQLSDDTIDAGAVIQAMSRNSRRAKKANKGSRPCSRAGRRKRKEKIGRRSR